MAARRDRTAPRRAPAPSRDRAARLAAGTVPVAVLTADRALARAGRRAGLVVAATGVLWVGATLLGASLGWDTRSRALFDLAALAGFAYGLYLTWEAWRLRRATRPKG